ncbi:MAG: hypothetical protein ACEQSU_12140 [Microgenomates group bacterium]
MMSIGNHGAQAGKAKSNLGCSGLQLVLSLARNWRGIVMLVLENARLIFLANPKTATQSTRAMLERFGNNPDRLRIDGARHMGVQHYIRKLRAGLETELGAPLESFAVMRAPLDHLHSWFRYRQRDGVPPDACTKGISFDQFVAATLMDAPPVYAKIGRQSQFLAAKAGRSQVEHLFDHAQMDKMITFLSARVGEPLHLPRRNVSPLATAERDLSAKTTALMHSVMAEDFALYTALRQHGYLAGGRLAA